MRRLGSAAFCILLALATTVVATPASPKTASAFPPAARAAMDRGLAVAKQRNWDLAIKYFSKVQKAAPENPTALFNLALAYDNAKCRELVAICWFHAYLTAAPNAPNVALVRKCIAGLEIAVENNMLKLAKLAEFGARKLPLAYALPKKYDPDNLGGSRHTEMGRVAAAYAMAGKAPKAYELVGEILGKNYSLNQRGVTPELRSKARSDLYALIAKSQAKVGAIADAWNTQHMRPVKDQRNGIFTEKQIENAVESLRREASHRAHSVQDWANAADEVAGGWVFLGGKLGGMPTAPDYTGSATSNFKQFLRYIKRAPPAFAVDQMAQAVEPLAHGLWEVRVLAGELKAPASTVENK